MALLWLVWAFAGMVIRVALSLVFLGLFAIANPVVSDWLSRAFNQFGDFLSNFTDYISLSRILLWYGAAFAIWGLLRYRPRRVRRAPMIRESLGYQPVNDDPARVHPLRQAADLKRGVLALEDSPPVEVAPQPEQEHASTLINWLTRQYQGLIVRSLVMMNAVFALQLILDSRYLVLGQPLPEGMSYAQYAHRGAYPLIFTALFAAAMVLAVFRPGGIAERSFWARRLVLLWIAQNVLLVVSAVWRLGGYVVV